MNLLENVKVIKCLTPSSDVYNTSPAGEEVNMENYNEVVFCLHQQTAGTNTGTATITLQACSDVSGTGAETVAFRYRKIPTGASDTLGALTEVAAAGFTTVANEHAVYLCHVRAAELPAGKPFIRIKTTEVVNDPVIGAVLAFATAPRYPGATLPTAIA